MTTLAANKPRAFELGDNSHIPVIASDIIFEGSAVGRVIATGHARPLAATDYFAGFSLEKADNSAGAAADINVEVRRKGQIQLPVSGAVITDVGQPVYATDDDAFQFIPTSAVFIGFVKRFVSAGVAIVSYDADSYVDPYAEWGVRETLTGTKTFDALDNGKAFFVTAAGDSDALTLPAIADALNDVLIVAIDAFGTTEVEITPQTADAIACTDLSAVADKDLILTKTTQQRGDSARLYMGDADGYHASLGNIVLGTASIWTKQS
jgi:hypothetical protein